MKSERAKYEACYRGKGYRKASPAHRNLQFIIDQLAPEGGFEPRATIIDFGCATGRAALELHKSGRFDITMIDIADNCLNVEVKERLSDRFKFIRHDLSLPIDISSDYGYCVDVMEHAPPSETDAVIDVIIGAAKKVLFIIAMFDHVAEDVDTGKVINLHLCLHDFDWWKEKLESRGFKSSYSKDHFGEYAVFCGTKELV